MRKSQKLLLLLFRRRSSVCVGRRWSPSSFTVTATVVAARSDNDYPRECWPDVVVVLPLKKPNAYWHGPRIITIRIYCRKENHDGALKARRPCTLPVASGSPVNLRYRYESCVGKCNFIEKYNISILPMCVIVSCRFHEKVMIVVKWPFRYCNQLYSDYIQIKSVSFIYYMPHLRPFTVNE